MTQNNMTLKDSKNISFLCFGGADWRYHNRGHIDMQLMRRFAETGTTLFVNSIMMQKPNLKKNVAGGKSFAHKLIRKTKSILRGLAKSGVGFRVYSPFSMPVHHIAWMKSVNDAVVRLQLLIAMRRLKMRDPVIWVSCPTACDVAAKIKHKKLVYQRIDMLEEYPHVDV